ncbi:MAG TPA: GntR family transcriptional regulator [Firmicutes bacterium]|nr:GntR family transcriptional regulator [Bacillota bacterium]
MPVVEEEIHNSALLIYNQVRSAILRGVIRPGERLTERKLMERFAVSRTPAREALKSLEREGLVRALPRSGTVVTSLVPKEVEEIYQVRLVLEPLAVSLAVTRFTSADREELEKMLAAMEQAVFSGEYLDYLRCDAAIHVWFARVSGNSLLMRMISDLTGHIVRLGSASIARPGRPEVSLSEHRAMAHALLERNGVEAANAMIVHLSNSRLGALETMQQGGTEDGVSLPAGGAAVC